MLELTGTDLLGLATVVVCTLTAAVAVLFMRRLAGHGQLIGNQDFVHATYPIIGLVYGTFLAFTIVITWGQFNEAETSATNEVTRLSELWRDAEAFPEPVCRAIHGSLAEYAEEVVRTGWPYMSERRQASPEVNIKYTNIWHPYYSFEPRTESEKAFYAESIKQLNALGRDRRQRILFATAKVQPMVRFFLISGGVLMVAFSLLLGCPSLVIQVAVTTLIAMLIGFSIFLVLSLQEPFSGFVSVKPTVFEAISHSFDDRQADEFSCRQSDRVAM